MFGGGSIERGGGEWNFKVAPVVMILVATGSPNFSHSEAGTFSAKNVSHLFLSPCASDSCGFAPASPDPEGNPGRTSGSGNEQKELERAIDSSVSLRHSENFFGLDAS